REAAQAARLGGARGRAEPRLLVPDQAAVRREMDSTLFVIVENTDDTLGQRRWMELIAELDDTLGEYTSAALGVWFNSVQAHVQQVVWGVEVPQATVPEVYDR